MNHKFLKTVSLSKLIIRMLAGVDENVTEAPVNLLGGH